MRFLAVLVLILSMVSVRIVFIKSPQHVKAIDITARHDGERPPPYILIMPMVSEDPPPTPTPEPPEPPKPPDERIAKVRKYLSDNPPGSPLQDYAELIVQTADKYGIDWRFIPVMSSLESSKGLAACGYNAWGWRSCGGYNFSSWEEAIDFVTQAMTQKPYAGLSFQGIFCMWVSGGGCDNDQALNYLAKAMREVSILEQ